MNYSDIRNDMLLAEAALKESKLDQAVSRLRLLCEVYCLTPFSWQTFYMRLYDGQRYTLQYAKPRIINPCGLCTVSTTFHSALKADAYPGSKGTVFGGIRQIAKNDPTIHSLVRCLPQKDELQEISTTIDGISTVIVNHTTTPSTALYFRNQNPFSINHYTDADAEFLHTLFIRMEELIGNLQETV